MEINKILNGDCLEVLKTLQDECVNCCVTSPPYYGLRDYGHEGQIGLEETPELFVAKMVEVFTEVKRVLKKDGTLWLNLGDSYAANRGYQVTQSGFEDYAIDIKKFGGKGSKVPNGYKPKDLIGIPWMVAFALRSAGWYLRQDIIWHKPNPMPESATDRCTKSHEYIFLLSKSQKYYYDNEAIKEDATDCKPRPPKPLSKYAGVEKDFALHSGFMRGTDAYLDRNKRSVWTVTTKPFSEAHFATFPEDLIVDCIKAGCPENGIVLDPFMGAGTTALVAAKLNRNFIGIELNEKYIKIAERRLQKELGMFNTLNKNLATI